MLMGLIKMIGLKFLAKKIAKIILEKFVYDEIMELVQKTDNTVDDDIAKVVIDTIKDAVDKV